MDRSFLLAGALAVLVSGSAYADGKSEFIEQSCDVCHSVASASLPARVSPDNPKGGDLSTLSTKDVDLLKRYMRMEDKLDGKSHKKPFKGTDEELTAILDWLLLSRSE